MLKRWSLAIPGLVLLAAAIAAMLLSPAKIERAKRPEAAPEATTAIVEDPVRAITLSPDGSRLAWIERRDGGTSLWLRDLDGGGEARPLLRRTSATGLAWSRDGQWLFLEAPGRLQSMTVASAPGSGIVTRLGGEKARDFLGVDRWQPAAVLVAEARDRDGDGALDRYRVLRFFPGGRSQILWTGSRKPSDALTAPDGGLFLRLIGHNRIDIVRTMPDGPDKIVYACRSLEQCSLASVDKAGALYLITSHGHDLDALYQIAPGGGPALVGADPKRLGDVEGLTVDRRTGRPLALAIPDAGGIVAPVTPPAEAVLAAVARKMPDAAMVQIASSGGERWLVGLDDGTSPTVDWSLVADGGATWDAAVPARHYPDPPRHDLPRRKLERFTASDGMRLFAYVTRPAGPDHGRRPLIVLLHGGPWNASPPGYSETAARLARQGYLVLEPQYRASRGFGRAYLTAAGDDLADGRLLADIRDSAEWMIARGAVDPRRVIAMGSSFGGYSSLLATTLWPELFAAAVAVVPPSDIGWNARYQASDDRASASGIDAKASFAELGLDIDDKAAMARLARQSPFALATRLERPVLILAGARDRKVPIRSVNHYVAKLCRAGKDVTYFVAPEAGHELTASETVAGSAWREIDRFLAQIASHPRQQLVDARMPKTPGIVRKKCDRK